MIFGVRAEAEQAAAGTRPLEVAGVDACLTDRCAAKYLGVIRRLAFCTIVPPPRTLEIAVFGTNLTDKHYAYTGGTLGAPPASRPPIDGTRRADAS
jgi:hypothetical protein